MSEAEATHAAALAAVREAVRADGGVLATVAAEDDSVAPADGALGALAAGGPRAQAHAADIAFVVEAIREGWLLHYGEPRVLADAEPDLRLLAGDRLYALGLARLAVLGDLAAVVELADVIALSAQAQIQDDAALSDAVWEAGAVAVGWGTNDAHRAAKDAARAGRSGAATALRAAARQMRREVAPPR